MAWKGIAAYAGALRNAVSVNRHAAQVVNSIVMQETQDLSVLNREVQIAIELEVSSRNLHTASVGVLNTLRNLKNSEQRHLADSMVTQKALSSVSNMMTGAFTRVGAMTPNDANRNLMSIDQIKARAMRDINITMQNSKFYNAARIQLRNLWQHYAKVKEDVTSLDSGLIQNIRASRNVQAAEQQVVAIENNERNMFSRVK